ncbi:TIGR03862 family flavoprotein [uncultured Alsobacter sp.]|uniref:TIGR03862 family flavoprotein n=1 Tax=uncultured Alsobacter sp. TaxID=1748258 RepID=UPI0025D30587|nr:TIGR03862 family flavoprotein [uncultured Alsobacter sp.]
MNTALPHVAIIGGGPAGLAAAEVVAGAGTARVTVYDAMPSVGRKLLMAGRGGLNLTHSEPLERFLGRYGAARPRLEGPIRTFAPSDLRDWATGLGQDTFVGSSGRVFPTSFKASPLLRAWLARLDGLGVSFAPRHRWTGWTDDGELAFATPAGALAVRADATILALGGASWPRLGSDGAWVDILRRRGVRVGALVPANSGFDVAWSATMRERFAGEPLKGLAVSFGEVTVRGEAVVTATGIEGGAIYALSGRLREALAGGEAAVLQIDLKPDLSAETLAERLARARPGESLSNRLRKAAGLTPVAIGLLRECAGPDIPRDPFALAGRIKAVPLPLTGVRPLERAISSAGGLAFDDLDARFMIERLPGVFAAGEMLDWEAPTGGYLLQGCWATGIAAGRGALAWLETSGRLAGPGTGP